MGLVLKDEMSQIVSNEKVYECTSHEDSYEQSGAASSPPSVFLLFSLFTCSHTCAAMPMEDDAHVALPIIKLVFGINMSSEIGLLCCLTSEAILSAESLFSATTYHHSIVSYDISPSLVLPARTP